MNSVNNSSTKYCAYQKNNMPAPVKEQFVPFVVSDTTSSTKKKNICERKITNPDGLSKCDQPSKKKDIIDEIKAGLAPLYEGFSPETIRSIYSGYFKDWKVSEGKTISDILHDSDDEKKNLFIKKFPNTLKISRKNYSLKPPARSLIIISDI